MTDEQIELAGYRITLNRDWLALYMESLAEKDPYYRDQIADEMNQIEAEVESMRQPMRDVYEVVDERLLMSK